MSQVQTLEEVQYVGVVFIRLKQSLREDKMPSLGAALLPLEEVNHQGGKQAARHRIIQKAPEGPCQRSRTH